MEWEELYTRLIQLKTVSARSDYGQNLVDELSSVGLNARPGRLPDMEETKCVEEIAVNWIASSNFRVSLLGVDLLSEVVGHLGVKFRHLMTKVDNQLISKLGDPKVKDPSIQMFLNIFKAAFGGPEAQQLERILKQAWNDRVWRVREGACHLLRHMLDRTCDEMFQGQAKEVGLSKLVPELLRLSDDDKQQEVREAAMEVFVAGYRCFGQRIKQDLYKRAPKRLNLMLAKMQDVVPDDNVIRNNQTPTRPTGSRPGSRTGSRTPSNIRTPNSRINSGTLGRKRTGATGATGGEGDGNNRLSAGAVGVSELENEYNLNLPEPTKFDLSERGVEQLLERAKEKLCSPKTEWEHRITELRLIRLIVLQQLLDQVNGAELRKLAPSFNAALADLRSSVTREACVTIASMAKYTTESSYGSLVNLLVPNLIKLIANSARIMSSSASSCLTVILRDCHNYKIISHFTEQVRESKSVITRRKCIEMVAHILKLWPESELRRQVVMDDITSTLHKTLQDPDSEARQTARDGFHCLYDKFPDEAERIRSDLPHQVQKMLQYTSLSRTGSQDSLTSNGSQASSHGSARTPGVRGRPRHTSASRRNPPTPNFKKNLPFGRSRSDLDPTAFHRFGPVAPVVSKTLTPKKFINVESRYSQNKLRTPTRKPTMSQPGSRSGSPPHIIDSSKRRTPSRIPRSAASSRESSPDGFRIDRDRFQFDAKKPLMQTYSPLARSPTSHNFRHTSVCSYSPLSRESPLARPNSQSGYKNRSTSLSRVNRRPLLAFGKPTGKPPPKPVGSERSGSVSKWIQERRESRSGSRCGSRSDSRSDNLTSSLIRKSFSSPTSDKINTNQIANRRILPSGVAGARLVADILGMETIVPSTAISRLTGAINNAERKDALAVIGRMSDQNQQLTKTDLRRLADTIQKLITTGTDKTLVHVFDVIPRILKAYAHEEPMKEWLYVLLTGILKRLGQLLGLHREKALEVLDAIRDEYPKDLIYSRVTKFLIDQTAVPSTGQKSAILRFLRDLTQYLEGSIIQNSSETRLVISKLVGWCNEPKNAEVRREAAASIRSLFALNPAQFSAALHELPKPFQEGATKALKENTVDSSISSEQVRASPIDTPPHHSLPHQRDPSLSSYSRSKSNLHHGVIPKYNKSPQPLWGSQGQLRKANSDLVGSHISYDITDMTKKIESLNFVGNIDDDETFLQAETQHDDLDRSRSPQSMRAELDNLDSTLVLAGVLEPVDLVNRPNSSIKPNMLLEAIRLFQRSDPDSAQAAMKIVREAIRDPIDGDGDDNKWNRVFPLLLETAEDATARAELRVTALHCLRDISETKCSVAGENAEMAITKFLAIMSVDQDDRSLKDVTRSSNNAALALLRNLSIWHCLTLLSTHVGENFPVGRDAIDLCRSIIEEKSDIISDSTIDTPEAQKSIHQLLTKLMEQWQSEQAAVRKAVVYCLVLFHIAKKEVVQPYLSQASTTNKRLFDLYLKKHTTASNS